MGYAEIRRGTSVNFGCIGSKMGEFYQYVQAVGISIVLKSYVLLDLNAV